MGNKNFISIIIPVYNRPKLVAECLDSVLAQINPNWECIVVDDGSTDDTWGILEDYAAKDKRIRIFKRDREPKGAPTCRNIGLQVAQSSLVMFLDSDDLLAPWAISNRLNYAEGQSFDMMIFNGFEFNNSDLKNRHERSNFRVKDLLTYFTNYQAAFCTPSVLWNKNFLITIGGWYASAQSSQDSILYLLALHKGARVVWGNESPDFFVRVTAGFNKISNQKTLKKLTNRLESLNYISTEIDNTSFQTYSYYFLIDLLNRVEYLSIEEQKVALNTIITKIEKAYKIKHLKLYYRLFIISKKLGVIHSIVYRIRKYFIVLPRIENLRERTILKNELFNELKKRSNNYPWLLEHIKVLNHE